MVNICYRLEDDKKIPSVKNYLKSNENIESKLDISLDRIACEEIIFNNISFGERNICVSKGNFIIKTPKNSFLIERNEELKYFIIEASQINTRKKPGDSVKKWDEIAVSKSKKGILRRIKIPFEGQIILVEQDPTYKPERIVFILK
ncbi:MULTISPECIES: DUF2118 domain-containing protein [Fervidicoccus]|jgi:hypothetical protein|uniref:DUF2118 domain-containing protein n=3 Tax=Fervidicoccus fontis TaxID=683846 RepID=I0A0D6_FERFK|nr:DUF2118 domain-containing protein [Fervidicoccus fontis]AFH42443.1 hypothetical protein FFONT_0453 [Fervidicoccus fontis Kam940]PMB76061.1 MAG: DUF2118 domain-containing protein [Fervidicoccus fontis]